MDWTDGWKVIEIHYKGDQLVGFVKVTKSGKITIEAKADIGCLPGEKIQLGLETYIVQKVLITKSRAEVTCTPNLELKKSIETKRKLKKALGEDDGAEQI
tara:strand:- start:1041 stop:1340 length:300 start_codon:yes stop_codon:yes gene_type:complete